MSEVMDVNTEQFEMLLKTAGIENWKQVSAELRNLKTELKDTAAVADKVAGNESGGTGFAGMTKGLFQAERIIGSLATGQGLARIGPMLEGVIGLLGGPAGIGFLTASFAIAAEKYLPQLVHYFNEATEATKKQAEALKQHEEAVKRDAAAVAKMIEQPTVQEAAAAQKINALLRDEHTSRQVKAGIAGELYAENVSLSPAERAELQFSNRMIEQAQKEGKADIGGFRIEHYQGIVQRLQDKRTAEVEFQANRMLLQLPESPEAQAALLRMIHRDPKAFPDGFASKLQHIIRDKNAARKPKLPSPEELEVETGDLMEQYERTPTRSGRDAIERRMHMIEMMQNPEIYGVVNPETLGQGSPVDRIIHPELYGPHARGIPRGSALDRQRDRSEPMAPRITHQPERYTTQVGIDAATRNVGLNQEVAGKYPEQKLRRRYDALQSEMAHLKAMLSQALGLEQQGVATHEKTQHVVAGIQRMLAPLQQKMRQLEANARAMQAGQQRSNQNTTGPF